MRFDPSRPVAVFIQGVDPDTGEQWELYEPRAFITETHVEIDAYGPTDFLTTLRFTNFTIRKQPKRKRFKHMKETHD